MPAARPLTKKERDDLIARDAFPDWRYVPWGESEPFGYKASDWGWHQGRLVALDYSAPAIFADDEDAHQDGEHT